MYQVSLQRDSARYSIPVRLSRKGQTPHLLFVARSNATFRFHITQGDEHPIGAKTCTRLTMVRRRAGLRVIASTGSGAVNCDSVRSVLSIMSDPLDHP